MGLGPSAVLRVRGYRPCLAFRGSWSGAPAAMQLAAVSTSDGGFWQSVPRRVFAKHLVPGQPGPKRVAMPASISSAWLTLFTIYFRRSWGWAFVHYSWSPFERLNRDSLWTVVPGPRPPHLSHAGADQAVTVSAKLGLCLLYTSPRPRDRQKSRMAGWA